MRVDWCDSPKTCQADLDKLAGKLANLQIQHYTPGSVSQGIASAIIATRKHYVEAVDKHVLGCMPRFQEGLGKLNSMRADNGEASAEDSFPQIDHDILLNDPKTSEEFLIKFDQFELMILEQKYRLSVVSGAGGLNVQRSSLDQYKAIKKYVEDNPARMQKQWRVTEREQQGITGPGGKPMIGHAQGILAGPVLQQRTQTSSSSVSQTALQSDPPNTHSSSSGSIPQSQTMGSGTISGYTPSPNQHAVQGQNSAAVLRMIQNNLRAKTEQLESLPDFAHLDLATQGQLYIDRTPLLRQTSAECLYLQKNLETQNPILPDFPQSDLDNMERQIEHIRDVVRANQIMLVMYFDLQEHDVREELLAVMESQLNGSRVRPIYSPRQRQAKSRSQSPIPLDRPLDIRNREHRPQSRDRDRRPDSRDRESQPPQPKRSATSGSQDSSGGTEPSSYSRGGGAAGKRRMH